MSTLTSRFAPSPTGYLHVGGARTALFSWLLARTLAVVSIDLRFSDSGRTLLALNMVEKNLSVKWFYRGNSVTSGFPIVGNSANFDDEKKTGTLLY